MKKRLLALLIATICTIKTEACLNLFSLDSAGNIHHLEHYFFSEIRFNSTTIEDELRKLKKKLKSKKIDYKDVSDYGAYLLMSGKFKDGLTIFSGLVKRFPDVYQVNANSAVAYELNGNIDSALYFQKKAMLLYGEGHEQSEWIHLKILEARKQLTIDPDWCLVNNVTDIIDDVKKNYRSRPHEDTEGLIFQQFILQLRERLPFTYAEDKVMGKLLLELGEAYLPASVYRAYYCYAFAKHLYPALASVATKRMQDIRKIYTLKFSQLPTSKPSGVLRMNDETKPPDDNEVAKFIERIVSRPDLRQNDLQTLSPAILLNKLR